MRSILLPQAITSMLPVLVSQLVVVLKDTAIGVPDHLPRNGRRRRSKVGSPYGNYVPALIVIAVSDDHRELRLSSFAVWLEGAAAVQARARAAARPEAIEQEGSPAAQTVV